MRNTMADNKRQKRGNCGGVATTGLDTVSLTVGTAGHIDHGKTELIRLLTGCYCDTLPEEHARGMTIDLGFATCELPNHRRVGIVDVPGHERFIHNMVAGASGIDTVLLVVAVDDGVMPQTIEHFHITRLLGIKSGMVAVTKIDLASESRIAEVEDQVRQLVKGSFLDTCPVVPVSARTGAGFEEFYNAFVATVDRTAERDATGAFRLHVERSFVLEGLGAIVSGIPLSGIVRVGDTLQLLPKGDTRKVRGIQVYGQDGEEGHAGECIALKMSGLSQDDVNRGMVLASPDYFKPTRFIDAKVHLLPNLGSAIKPRTAIRLHIGTSDIPGHLVLPELKPLAPGAESYAQFQLKYPAVVAPGDFFVIRSLSPARTLGGGYVVAPDEMRLRRSRKTWSDEVNRREIAFKEPITALAFVLEHAGKEPLQLMELARQAFLNEETATENIASLLLEGTAIELHGKRFVHSSVLTEAGENILRHLSAMHDEEPLKVGFPRKKLFPQLSAGKLVIEKALKNLEEKGQVKLTAQGYQVLSRAPSLSPKQAALAEKITAIYNETGLASPRKDQLAEMIGTPAPILAPVFDHLVQRGALVVLSDKVVLGENHLDESKKKLLTYFETHESLNSGAAKGLFETSRKYVIPMLEYWDAQGLTKRIGNERMLKKDES